MLKIEKIARTSEIILEFQKKQRLTPFFIQAAFLAFFIHLFAFLLFHIGPFKIVNHTSLPKAFVETIISESEMNVSSNIEGEKKYLRYVMAPKVSLPSIPNLSDFNRSYEKEGQVEMSFLTNPFSTIEAEFQHQSFFSKKKIESKSPIKILLSGNLADKTYKGNLSLNFTPKKAILNRYALKVENKTGRIFWLERVGLNLKSDENEWIKDSLKKLQFEKIEKGIVTSGEIEIRISVGQK